MRTCAPLVVLGLCPKLKYPPLCGGIIISFLMLFSGVVGFSRKLLSAVYHFTSNAMGCIVNCMLHTFLGVLLWLFALWLLPLSGLFCLLLCGDKRTPHELLWSAGSVGHNAGRIVCFVFMSFNAAVHLRLNIVE